MKVLLCDDHALVREGLRAILEKHGYHIVGEAADGRAAIELSIRMSPELVIMDISMPEMNGVDATRRLLSACKGTRVIAVSVSADHRYVDAMFAAGASGYLVKTSASNELMAAIRAVASGLSYVSAGMTGCDRLPRTRRSAATSALAGYLGAAGAKVLTPREREVLQLIAEGKSSKAIAARLDIAATTVETHRRQIMDKLNLRTIAELTKYAVREGLSPLD